MNKQEVIMLQEWWIGELDAIMRKVTNEEEKRKEKAAKRAEKLMGEYRTYADIQDAYGMGAISDRMHDKLLDLLEDRNKVRQYDRMYTVKMELLREFREMAREIIQDNGGGEGDGLTA